MHIYTWEPFESLEQQQQQSTGETNLFVKVGIKYNQVEVTFQALNGSSEEVIFGTASLQNIQKIYSSRSFCFCTRDENLAMLHTWIW